MGPAEEEKGTRRFREKRDAILARIGLDAQTLARDIVEDVTALDRGLTLVEVDHTA